MRSSNSISCARCARCRTIFAAGRPSVARCNAAAAKRFQFSIPNASGSDASSAARRSWSITRRSKSPIRPQSLLPFKVSESAVREQIRRWYASKWLAPGKLKSRALVDTVHGIYIPYWTFDAQVVCPWEADAGHYYYTTESYRDNQGREQTRQVQHVRWEPASGVVDHFFDDEPVAGTRGVSHSLLAQVEPFMTNELVPYDTSYLAGFVVEHYQVVLLDAAKASEEAMTDKVRDLAAAQIPGDTYRNLTIHPTFSDRTFKHSPRSGLAADVYLRPAGVPGCW